MMGMTPGPLVCALFLFFFDDYVGRVKDSVGRVSGMGSGVFVSTGIKSIGDVVPLVMFVPKVVDCKGSRLIEIFWPPRF